MPPSRGSYGGERRIHWMEIYAGEKATSVYGSDTWLPEETLEAVREYSVSIKGPLTTPVGGGIRSLNVALRQELDLYVCLRPVRYFPGVPSPLKDPARRRTWSSSARTRRTSTRGSSGKPAPTAAKKMVDFLQNEMGVRKIRFPETSSIGVKPVSREGTERLVRRAIEYAITNGRDSVTLVHKGNIMKFTEGGFRDWGYALARERVRRHADRRRPLALARDRRPDDHDQGRDRRRLPAADPPPARRVRRDRDAEPERRLHLGRARRAGRRHRDRARGRTSPTRSRCSRPRTGRRRSTPARTR